MSTYTDTQIREFINENYWRFLGLHESSGNAKGIVRRYLEQGIDLLTKDGWDQAIAILRTCTSAKNLTASRVVTNPLIDGEVKTGTWYGGPIDVEKVDGTWRLVQTLFRVSGEIEQPYLAEDGCFYKVYRTFYVDVAARPVFSPAKSSGRNWTSQFEKDPETQLYSGWTERTERVYQNVPQFKTTEDTFEYRLTTKHFGVRAGNVDESGSGISIPDPANAADGSVLTVSKEKDADCTQRIQVDEDVAKSIKSTEATSEEDGFEKRTEIEDTAESAPGSVLPVQAEGQVQIVSSKKMRNKNRWIVRIVTFISKAVASSGYRFSSDTFENTAETEARGQTAALGAPTPADGTVVERDGILDRFLRWTNRNRVTTAANVKNSDTTTEEDGFEKRVEAEDTAESAPGSVPATQAAGQVQITSSRKMRFKNRWIVRVVTFFSKAIANSGFRYSADAYESTAETEARGQTAALAAPTLADGTVVERDGILDRFLRWTHRNRVTTAANVKNSDTTTEEDGFEKRVEVEDTAESAPGSVPATQAAGQVQITSSRKMRFKNRWIVRVVTFFSKAIATVSYRYSSDTYETASETEARGQTAALAAPTPADGTVVERDGILDRFLRWSNRQRTVTAANVKNSETLSEEDGFEKRTENEDTGELAPGSALGAQVAGEVKVISSRKMRFKNRWVVRVVTFLSKAIGSSGYRFSANAYEATAETEARGQLAAQAAPTLADGTVVERDGILDRFLRWTHRNRVTTAANVKDSDTTAEEDAFIKRTEIENTAESAAVPIPLAQVAGEVKVISSQKMLFKNRWITKVSTFLAKFKAGSVSEGQEDFFSKITITEDLNATAAATRPGAQVGKIFRFRAALNRFLRYDNRNEIDESKAAAQPLFVAELGDRVARSFECQWGQASIPNATLGQRIFGKINRHGTADWERYTEAAVSGLLASTPPAWTLYGGTYHVEAYTEFVLANPIFPYGPGKPVYYYRFIHQTGKFREKHVFTKRWFATEEAGEAFISGGNLGSSVRPICAGCWEAVKITRDDGDPISTTSFPDPYEALRTA